MHRGAEATVGARTVSHLRVSTRSLGPFFQGAATFLSRLEAREALRGATLFRLFLAAHGHRRTDSAHPGPTRTLALPGDRREFPPIPSHQARPGFGEFVAFASVRLETFYWNRPGSSCIGFPASALEISNLTLREKLQLMEVIWADLRGSVETFEAPVEHRQLLDRRRERVAAGEAVLRNWDSVKHRIGRT